MGGAPAPSRKFLAWAVAAPLVILLLAVGVFVLGGSGGGPSAAARGAELAERGRASVYGEPTIESNVELAAAVGGFAGAVAGLDLEREGGVPGFGRKSRALVHLDESRRIEKKRSGRMPRGAVGCFERSPIAFSAGMALRDIERVFVLNLLRRSDLRERFEPIVSRLGWPFEFVAAVDGREVDEPYLRNRGFALFPTWKLPSSANPYDRRRLVEGEIGCSLSHYFLWKRIVEEDIGLALVFEDDVELAEGFERALRARLGELADEGVDWHILYLNSTEASPGKPRVNERIFVPGFAYGSYGYVLSAAGARLLIDGGLDRSLLPVDEFLPAMYAGHRRPDVRRRFGGLRPLKALSVAPAMVLHPLSESVSDIETSGLFWPRCLLRKRLRISPFTLMGWGEDQVWVGSALTGEVLSVDADQAPALFSLLHAFAVPATPEEVAGGLASDDASREDWLEMSSSLIDADVLRPVENDEVGELSPKVGAWRLHDVLFHRNSRQPAERFTMLSIPEAGEHEAVPIALETGVELSGPVPRSLFDLLDLFDGQAPRCASVSEPIPRRALGALLFAATRRREGDAPAGRARGIFAATAGALGLYVALGPGAVEGIGAGLYRHRAEDHHLEPLAAGHAAVEPFLVAAAQAGQLGRPPSCVLLVTCHLGRLRQAFGEAAYAVALKEVGALLQKLTLIASALDLAPLPLAWGEQDRLLADLAGFAPEQQPLVGELALASR